MRVKAMINDPNIFHLFCIAFTHEDVHRQENIDEYGEVYFPKSKIDYGNSYETLETIGDGSINKAITWYYQQAYPKLRISGNLSKVKAYMGSNIAIAEHFTSYFKLTQFLIAPPKIFDNPPVKIVGDITESFLGALEVAIEYKWGVGAGGVYGMGYATCARFVMTRCGELEEDKIPIRRNIVENNKMILKEIVDKLNKEYSIKFPDERKLFDERYKKVGKTQFKAFKYVTKQVRGDINTVEATLYFPKKYNPIVITRSMNEKLDVIKEVIAREFVKLLKDRNYAWPDNIDYSEGEHEVGHNLPIVEEMSKHYRGYPLLWVNNIDK